jgi:hypothetical protein
MTAAKIVERQKEIASLKAMTSKLQTEAERTTKIRTWPHLALGSAWTIIIVTVFELFG